MLELIFALVMALTTPCPSEDSGSYCHHDTDDSVLIVLADHSTEPGAFDKRVELVVTK